MKCNKAATDKSTTGRKKTCSYNTTVITTLLLVSLVMEDTMANIENISKMEKILDDSLSLIDDMISLKTRLDEHMNAYQELNEYYYSEDREQDLEADDKGLLPADLKRGVLSEDGIWNMQESYVDAAIGIMESALEIIKKK